MPFHYEVDDARGVVIGTGIGRLTGAELLRAQRAILEDLDFNPSYHLLVDFTAVRETQISAADVRTIASLPAFSPGSRRGYVVVDPVQYGLLRMFQAYADGHSDSIRLFAVRADAERWVIDGHEDAGPDGTK